MADDTEYIKLPLLQRCSHKLWKARVHGYTEAAKVFQEEDEKSPVFGQYVALIPKFVSDTHAAAQEKGLEATLHFVQNSSVAGKTVKDVMGGIIAKSIAAPKKTTQDLSVQIILMYIEIEKQESVIEELVKGLEHKNPKIVAACLTTLTTSLKEFGSQVVGIKPLIKPILGLIEDRDKTVRDETKNLVVEIYRWIGEAIKPQLTKLKPIQLTELEAEFAKVKGEKAVPIRYLRSQQARQAKAAGGGGSEDEVDEGTVAVAEAEVDPLSLIDPINILTKIPNDFYEQIEAKKWQDRKQALENLDEILNYPKFEKAEYGDLVRALMKIVTKDSNVVVVGVATKCVARLASGLKKNFHPYASATLPQLLAKFKEKKANVVTPLREAVDAIFPSTNLEAIMEDVIASLDNKNPSIKAETAAFLGRCFAQSTPTALSKKLLKPYTTSLLKTLNEPDPSVRDSSAEALGIAMKVVGEKNILPFLPDIDPLKLAKIKECCDKAVVKTVVVVVKTREPTAAPVKPKKVVEKPEPVKKQVVQEDDFEEEKVEEKKTNQRIDISPKITEQLLAELGDKNWKVRNDALLSIQAMLTDTRIKPNLGDLPGVLIQRFVDSNSKLIVTALEICTSLAIALGPGSKNYVRTFARGIFNALGDNKQWVRSAASTCLNAWVTEAGAKEFFSGEIIPDVLKTSSPALKIEVWTWLAEILPTVKGLPKDELCLVIPCLFSALEDRNADVRKAGNSAVYGLMIHVGYYNMAKDAEKLKPASKAGIMQVLDKVRPDVPEAEPKTGTKPKVEAAKGRSPAPKSAPAKKARSSIAPNAVKPVARKKEEEVDTSPLLVVNKLKNQRVLDEQKLKIIKWNFTTPRAEFVDLLKEQMTTAGFSKTLIANMFHADFKFHIKAIESLMDDLHNEEALIANLDLILKWMTLRFFDTNPSVLLKGLEYLQTAFNILIDKEYTMFDVEANAFVPYLIMKVGDPKDAVRDRVHAILKQFSQMHTPGKLFVHIMDGLKSKNSRLRTECLEELGYLIEQFGTSVCMPSSAVALKEISKQISDRDNSVRSAALNAIVKAYFVDGDKIYKQIGKLSDKDMSYLEERIKRASQNRTKMVHDVTRVQEAAKPEPEVEDYDEPMPEPEAEIEKQPSPEPLPPVLHNPYKPYPGLDIQTSRMAKLDLVEIDDGFLNEPVLIPESIYQKMKYKTPPNPLLEEIFNNLSGDDVTKAIDGAKKLHATMQSEVGDKLQPYSRGILDAIVTQMQKANTYNLITHPDLGQLYKTLFRNIDDIFSKKTAIGMSGDEEQLKCLIRELLIALVDDKTKLFQGSDLNQWIIVFVANIIENSDTTNVTCASINALYDLVGNPPANPKLTDLSVKCVLKIVVTIKRANDLDAIINLDRVLYTCHLFMQAYPRHTWKDRPSDVPLKAIKTLLMNLVLKKGIGILTHLRSIENPISSEVAIYLKKMIKQQPTTASKSTKLTKEASDNLSKIFKKIASESEGSGKEGLVQLYEFKRDHPEVDLSVILAPTTQFFKEFVSEGLKQIENERGPLKKAPETVSSNLAKMDVGVPIDAPDPPADFRELPQYYLTKLRMYQQRLGYPVSNLPDFKPFDANSNTQ